MLPVRSPRLKTILSIAIKVSRSEMSICIMERGRCAGVHRLCRFYARLFLRSSRVVRADRWGDAGNDDRWQIMNRKPTRSVSVPN
jgi:hypothetical protein